MCKNKTTSKAFVSDYSKKIIPQLNQPLPLADNRISTEVKTKKDNLSIPPEVMNVILDFELEGLSVGEQIRSLVEKSRINKCMHHLAKIKIREIVHKNPDFNLPRLFSTVFDYLQFVNRYEIDRIDLSRTKYDDDDLELILLNDPHYFDHIQTLILQKPKAMTHRKTGTMKLNQGLFKKFLLRFNHLKNLTIPSELIDQSLVAFSKNAGQLESLNISGGAKDGSDIHLKESIKHMKNLKSLDLAGCKWVTSSGFNEMLKHCKHLEELNVNGLKLAQKELVKVISAHVHLKRLSLALTDQVSLSIAKHLPKLEYLDVTVTLPDLTNQGFKVLAAELKELKVLKFRPLNGLASEVVESIAKNFPNLQEFYCIQSFGTQNSLSFKESDLQEIVKEHSSLKTLSFSGYVSDSTLKCITEKIPDLEKLKLGSEIPKAHLDLLNDQLPHLKLLQFSYSDSLDDLDLEPLLASHAELSDIEVRLNTKINPSKNLETFTPSVLFSQRNQQFTLDSFKSILNHSKRAKNVTVPFVRGATIQELLKLVCKKSPNLEKISLIHHSKLLRAADLAYLHQHAPNLKTIELSISKFFNSTLRKELESVKYPGLEILNQAIV